MSRLEFTVALLLILFFLAMGASAQTEDARTGNSAQPSPSSHNSLACSSCGTWTAVVSPVFTDTTKNFTVNQFQPKNIGPGTCVSFGGAINGSCTTTTAQEAIGATVIPVTSSTNILAKHWIRIAGGTNTEFWVKVSAVNGNNVTIEAPLPYVEPNGSSVDGPPAQQYFLHPNVLRPTQSYGNSNMQRFPGCVSWPIASNTATTITVSVPTLNNGATYPSPAQADGAVNISAVGDTYSIEGDWLVEDYVNANLGAGNIQRGATNPLGNLQYLYTISAYPTPPGSGADSLTEFYMQSHTLLSLFGVNDYGYQTVTNYQMNPDSFGDLPASYCDGTEWLSTEVSTTADLGDAVQALTAQPVTPSGRGNYPASPFDEEMSNLGNSTGSDMVLTVLSQTPDVWDVRFGSALKQFYQNFLDSSLGPSAWGLVGDNNNAPWYSHVEYSESDSWSGLGVGVAYKGNGGHNPIGVIHWVIPPFEPVEEADGLSSGRPALGRNTDPLSYGKMALRDFLRALYDPNCPTLGTETCLLGTGGGVTFSYGFNYPCQTMGASVCTTDTSINQRTNLPWNGGANLGHADDEGQFLFHFTPGAGTDELKALNNLNAAWGTAYTSWEKQGTGDVLQTAVRTGTAGTGANSTGGTCANGVAFNGKLVANAGSFFTALDQGSVIEMQSGGANGSIARVVCIGTTSSSNDTAFIWYSWANAKFGGGGALPANGDTFRVSGHYDAPTSCSGTALADTTNTPFIAANVGQRVILFDALSSLNQSLIDPVHTSVTAFTDSGHVTLANNCPTGFKDLRYAVVAWTLSGAPAGTGFMDENGRQGVLTNFGVQSNYEQFQTITPGPGVTTAQRDKMVQALNLFNKYHARRMYSVMARETKDAMPNLLIENQELFATDQIPTVQGAAGFLDLWLSSPAVRGCSPVGDFTSAGCIVSQHMSAEQNSSVFASFTNYQCNTTFWCSGQGDSQVQRGSKQGTGAKNMFGSRSGNGVYPTVGYNYFTSSGADVGSRNYGFFTALGNPYNGLYDVVASVPSSVLDAHGVQIPCHVSKSNGSTTLPACNDTFTYGSDVGSFGDYGTQMRLWSLGAVGAFGGMYATMNAVPTVSVTLNLPVSSGTLTYGLCSADTNPNQNQFPTTQNFNLNSALSSNTVTLTGLAPESVYCYKIPVTGAIGTFRTATATEF